MPVGKGAFVGQTSTHQPREGALRWVEKSREGSGQLVEDASTGYIIRMINMVLYLLLTCNLICDPPPTCQSKGRKCKGSGMKPNLADIVVIIITIMIIILSNSLLLITMWKEMHVHSKCKSPIKCIKIQSKKTHNNGHSVTIIAANCILVYLLIFFFYVNVQRCSCVFVLCICMFIFLILCFN